MSQTVGELSLPKPSNRVPSIDILRGIIMVVMALDHTRDYFSGFGGDPLDFHHASVIMFFTRWITHFCAPVFVFLSGASAFLSLNRGKTKKQASWTLFTRGVWLIILEVTILRFGWAFNLDYHRVFVQVIWAIGWSMIFLSVLIWLPEIWIAIIGGIIVLGHNLFDRIKPMDTAHPTLWKVLHAQGSWKYGDHYTYSIGFYYPLIPWIGVMALGYCFGRILLKPAAERNKWLYRIGLSAIVGFIVLRFSNLYGNPNPWHHQDSHLNTLLDFIRCQKYPPSLLYLLMTIGPAITAMPLLDKLNNGIGRFFTVYGRVPLFYYILHIYTIHGLALITGLAMGFPISEFTSSMFQHSQGWGFSLPIVYLYWAMAVLILYLPCRWYMRIKMQYRKWWMGYL